MFLSQLPYLPLGDLRTVVSYPARSGDIVDERLREVLTRVSLPHLRERLDEEQDWAKVLSPGEQQRVAFARVLLTRPKAVFLDEATSALDEGLALAMYELLRAELPDTIVVSVSHRSSLEAYHEHHLELLDEAPGGRTRIFSMTSGVTSGQKGTFGEPGVGLSSSSVPDAVCSMSCPSPTRTHPAVQSCITTPSMPPSTTRHFQAVWMTFASASISLRSPTVHCNVRLALSHVSWSISSSEISSGLRISRTPNRSSLSCACSWRASPASTASSSSLRGAVSPKSSGSANSMPTTLTPSAALSNRIAVVFSASGTQHW